MAERLTPGVYAVDVSGGSRPIESEGTSTFGVVGEAARGIPDRPTFVSNFGAFQRAFGGHRRGEAGYLAHAVESFFENGGKRCFVVRVLPSSATVGESPIVLARSLDAWGNQRDILRIRARGEGGWPTNLRIDIGPSTSFANEAFSISVNWVENGRSRTVEPRFDNLRMDPEHENYVVRAINERSRYIEIEDLVQLELDREIPLWPPLPESVAGLDLASTTGTFAVSESATLDFRWTDGAAGDADHAATIVFPDDAASMSANEMGTLLLSALGSDYRVLSPQIPAAITTSTGPFDLSDGNPLSVSIDGTTTNITFAAPTAAQLTFGAGPFADLVDGFTLELIVNGITQSYTLVAADVADGATGATRAETRDVIAREFTSLDTSLTGGILRVSTIATGPAATSAVSGASATAFGNPAPSAGNIGVTDMTAATAVEIVAIVANTIGDFPYRAAAIGNVVRIEQADMNTHTLSVTATTSPDALFPTTATANGPVATGRDDVRIEPAVASRAYLTVRLLDGIVQFEADGSVRTVQINVAIAGNTNTIAVAMAADEALSPAEFAAAINAAAAASTDELANLSAEASEQHVTLTAGPNAAGTAITVSINGAAIWRDEVAIDGASGALVDSQSGIEISLSEPFLPGIPRISSAIFPFPRNAGRDENATNNPGQRPTETDDDPLRLLGGTDGTGPVSVDRYRGTITATGRRTGMRAFEGGPVAMLAIPGRNDAATASMAMGWCDLHDVFFILDGPGSVSRDFETSADSVRQWVEGLPARSDNACAWYPWVRVPDTTAPGRSPTRFMPPSGQVAGIYARTDITRGVWKAGAGIEAGVTGAIGLQHRLVDADQDLLNPVGVNCIRQMPGTGVILWGARTLTSNPEWRYVPVRRMALFLKRSMRPGLLWAVYEPNDNELWEQIRINITSFMLSLFQQGAFQGASPDEAFVVQCDRETNPQELVDQGIVTARVGFAPLKPAEFVVIELFQKSLVGV